MVRGGEAVVRATVLASTAIKLALLWGAGGFALGFIAGRATS